MATLSISIPTELAEMIDEKVKSGMYFSASEVVGESLILLRERDAIQRLRLEELRRELAKAEKQIEDSDYTIYHAPGEFAQKIIDEGNRILASRGEQSQ